MSFLSFVYSHLYMLSAQPSLNFEDEIIIGRDGLYLLSTQPPLDFEDEIIIGRDSFVMK